ncbi:D-2-hydroxyacid dehydrogenase [Alkalicella caledoniensis]|uniref:D-2-hydroxyacid dehydrogenase n=1 Tax=Alkalicella caledoniensis TaxID=2731377 RepID=A0A7G9W5N1_ALKCA|nr:NAD(P)-dependent oxidoreductase [Alkalicella caledoniensis]QNO13993.1 D-2-hydroxyacid dehydrogenase [Alkalicella caledoniensis]
MKTVFLNSSKVNFDGNLDYSPLSKASTLANFHSSSPEEILERVKDHDIVITKEIPLGGDLIRNFPPCVKLICEAGTGYNNIDLVACKEKGITVCNIPGYSTDSVAQLAITLLLSLSSYLTQQQNMIQNNNFNNFTKHLQVPHFELNGKTLGIIGAGTIGQGVIKVARALGMNILTYNRTPKLWDDPRVKSVSLDDLLAGSDLVSLHCPLTPQTKHLIDITKLKLMKPSAYLINTSRGALINETDLITALQENIIAGAGLDVLDPEPPTLDNPLFYMDNVILTPHIGWQTLEARQRLINLLGENIKAFINGTPMNVVK